MPEWRHTLTVDASFDNTHGVTGIGIIIQERGPGRGRGPVLDRISESHFGVSPGAAEEFAVLRALEIAIERGFTRVKVRSDYNSMRRKLRGRLRQKRLKGDGLRGRILQLTSAFEWLDFGLVARRKNQEAHRLARQACTGRSGGRDSLTESSTLDGEIAP